MKRFTTAITVILILSLFVLPVFAANLVETISEISPIGTIPAEDSVAAIDDYGIAPDHLYPFIYSEEDSFHFFREYVIGPNNCLPGYLYVKNINTGEITQILEDPILTFTETSDYLYCVTRDNAIVKTDYSGKILELICPAFEDKISSIEYYNEKLYFLNGNKVQLYDLATAELSTLLEKADLISVFPYDDNKLLLRNNESDPISYNISTQQATIISGEYGIDSVLSESNAAETTAKTPTVSVYAHILPVNDIPLPIPGYENNSYFTISGTACNHEKTNVSTLCKSYKGMYECMGFAYYVSETYAHLPASGSVVRATGDYYTCQGNDEYDTFTSDSDVRIYFLSLAKGAYVRLSRTCKGDDQYDPGTHSIVYVSTTNTGVWTYDSHRTGNCKIAYELRTFADLRLAYPYIVHHISHSYTEAPQAISEDRHSIGCKNCTGYLTSVHTFSTLPNGGQACSECGYIVGNTIE